MNNDNHNGMPKRKKGRGLIIGLGLLGTGLLTYFGIQLFNKQNNKEPKQQKASGPDKSQFAPTPKPTVKKPTGNKTTSKPKQEAPLANDNFPLKLGSKGPRVLQLKTMLIQSLSNDALPKGRSSDAFDSELEALLSRNNLPTVIDETNFRVLTKSREIDAISIARALYLATTTQQFDTVLHTLKQLKNTDEYSRVSREFLKYRINGVHQTPVNGILSSFKDEKQKQQLRLTFAKIGLRFDGQKWSLSGTENNSLIITIGPARVWKDPKHSVAVPGNMLLGEQITQRGLYTLFQNSNQFYLVKSADVMPYKNNNA